MSPLPRLHHHDIMTIVGLFFIYIPFVTIRCIMLLRFSEAVVVEEGRDVGGG